MMQRIYLLLAHPDARSFDAAMADAYEAEALARGHEVRRQNLGDMDFDPTLWRGYKERQGLEPDLKTAQENILWCSHWVIVYPMWWGSYPARFKGFLDRTLLPGFAFKYRDDSPLPEQLLKGRSAQLLITSDAPTAWIRLVYQNADVNSLRQATLSFCGFKPVNVRRFDRLKYRTQLQRERMLGQVRKLVPAS